MIVTIEWEPWDEIPKPYQGPKRGVYVAVDYPAEGQTITACHDCLSWEAHVDIIESPAGTGPELVVREWHREDCDLLQIIRSGVCHGRLEPGAYCARCGSYNADKEPVPTEGEEG
ncbi:hypothetical protein ICW40_01210 [Actinotalea ferrariae]|uniref:hypothetical protein n=1 Tax=Actinotalea ferrariae TaxID=1386098 RepID=UPI001C8BC367|nr:hypothetical protein [Actinotalea ferrariae]MBX9243424.1 hypothetical protein [Actinotalea ferrariae]